MPSLVHYAKDRMDMPSTLTEVLRGISDIEQFYINLYHEFQEAIPLKDKIIEALSYQDLYALEVFREMKRENPSLVQSPAVIAQAFQGRMQQAARAAYAHKPLVAYYVENNIKQLRESEKTEIEALQKDVAALENLKQKLKEMDSDKPGLEEAVKKIKAKIQQLEQRDPHTNLQIKLSEISEKAVSRAVQENLPLVIAVGFIEPGQWHKKILDLLEGPSEKISKQYPHLLEKEEEYIVTKRADISLYVEVTLSRYVENGKLLPKQKGEILEEIEDLITHYQTVFPNKEIHSLCGLCLMAARNMVYQEYYNGAVFTGCDHGVKHIRHSILMANKCIKHLIRWAINERDIFAIQLVHIFHAFGYSIGFAGDHSIVSAAFLNANRRFLVDVLDEDMFDAVVRSVEKHPYIHPDFTPEMNRSRNKVQSSFVRAVTSLSYYCSLATNGKTQDFWMDLEAMLIASRLKVFVTNHPEYGDKFNPPRPQTYAENYRNQLIGSPNAMDRLAAEIYDGVLQDCKKLIKDTPGMPEHIKERFLRGIEQNFSYFAANLVVGQVGVTIEEVVLIPREGASIKFVPSFDIPPSTLYSILEVGFGDEEPFSANDKLLKEFTPAPERIEEAIKQAAAKTREIYSTKARFDDEYLQMTTIMKRLSYGKDNARIDGQLRGGQVDADLFPNVAFNATELLTALDLLKRINDHWKKELKPINELFDKEQPQKVINKYVKELESLRDDPSKFTVVNELTDKYKKQFSDLDSFYSEMGIETKFQETFEKGTKTIAQGLCPLAKKWAEGEKLFKLCYTYLTTHNIDVREVFFLVPGKKDIYNELALLKKEATDKLVAQIMEVQKVV